MTPALLVSWCGRLVPFLNYGELQQWRHLKIVDTIKELHLTQSPIVGQCHDWGSLQHWDNRSFCNFWQRGEQGESQVQETTPNQPAKWLQVEVEVGGARLEPNRDYFFKFIEEGSKTIWVSCYMNGSLVSIMRNLVAYIEEIQGFQDATTTINTITFAGQDYSRGHLLWLS